MVTTERGGATSIWRVQVRDAVEQPACPGPPTTKNYPVRNVKSAQVKKTLIQNNFLALFVIFPPSIMKTTLELSPRFHPGNWKGLAHLQAQFLHTYSTEPVLPPRAPIFHGGSVHLNPENGAKNHICQCVNLLPSHIPRSLRTLNVLIEKQIILGSQQSKRVHCNLTF